MRAEGRPSILCYIVRSIAVPSSLSMPGSIDDVVSSNVCPFKFRIVFVAEQNSPVVVPNTHKHTQPMLLSARASSTVYNKANKKLAEKSIEKKSVIDANRPGELIVVADDTKQAQASRITHNQVENWPIMSNCSARGNIDAHIRLPFAMPKYRTPHPGVWHCHSSFRRWSKIVVGRTNVQTCPMTHRRCRLRDLLVICTKSIVGSLCVLCADADCRLRNVHGIHCFPMSSTLSLTQHSTGVCLLRRRCAPNLAANSAYQRCAPAAATTASQRRMHAYRLHAKHFP